MKKLTLLGIMWLWLGTSIILAQIVYVDNGSGNDGNSGSEISPVQTIGKALEIVRQADNEIRTIKINPGIYVLDHHLSVETEKELNDERIVIEASILPDDTTWNPEKMPVIMSEAMKGEFENERWVVAFLINANHVTVRGLKFQGYAYPNTQYFPIARSNIELADLLVQQCMFVADEQSSAMQVGVIGHGGEIKIDHCIFYKANNAVVYYLAAGDAPKKGNRFTNNIVYGAAEAAIWTSYPDEDFVFENNIIANNNYFWKRFYVNHTNYTIQNSIIVNNDHYHIEVAQNGDETVPEYDFNEENITRKGTVSLRLLDGVFQSIPNDHLHTVPNSPGSALGAGLFMNKVQTE